MADRCPVATEHVVEVREESRTGTCDVWRVTVRTPQKAGPRPFMPHRLMSQLSASASRLACRAVICSCIDRSWASARLARSSASVFSSRQRASCLRDGQRTGQGPSVRIRWSDCQCPWISFVMWRPLADILHHRPVPPSPLRARSRVRWKGAAPPSAVHPSTRSCHAAATLLPAAPPAPVPADGGPSAGTLIILRTPACRPGGGSTCPASFGAVQR